MDSQALGIAVLRLPSSTLTSCARAGRTKAAIRRIALPMLCQQSGRKCFPLSSNTASEHPSIAVGEIGRRSLRVSLAKLFITRDELPVPFLGRAQAGVWYLAQVVFHFPEIARRETPVVVSERVEIGHGVAGDSSRQVNVRIEITPRQIARASEHREASVQARVARAPDRTPQPIFLKDEDDVIQLILRFEAEQQRRIAVLFQHDRRHQRRFHTVCLFAPQDFTKGTLRLALALPVIRQRAQVALYLSRSPQPLNQAPLFSVESISARRIVHRQSY